MCWLRRKWVSDFKRHIRNRSHSLLEKARHYHIAPKTSLNQPSDSLTYKPGFWLIEGIADPALTVFLYLRYSFALECLLIDLRDKSICDLRRISLTLRRNWLTVGVCFLSTHVFGCPLPTFYQFALGWVSLTNLYKSLNDMTSLGNFLERWAFGGLGG